MPGNLGSIGEAYIDLRLNLGTIEKDAQNATRKIGKNLDQLGQSMKGLGTNLTIGLTAPLVAAGGAATKFATDFEREMTKIETLVGVDAKLVEQFNQQVLDMAGAVGRGPQELAEALFVVTSAGQRGAEAMDILEQSAKAAAIGLGETKEIARAVTSAVNAYGIENLNAKRATEIMVATVREGNLEAADLAGSLGRVIGIASQVGTTFSDVGGFIATFTRLGVSAEESVTALRGVLSVLIKPTKQTQEALASVGLTAAEVRKQISERGLSRTFVDLVGAFKGNDEALGQLIPNIRALSGVMGTAGAQADAFIKISDNVANSLGIIDEGFERTKDTVAQQWAELVASFQVAGIEIGNAILPILKENLIPVLKDFVAWVKETATWFKGLPAPIQKATIAVLAFAAAIGPLLIGAGIATSGLGSIVKFFSWVGGAGGAGAAAGKVTIFAKAWGFLGDKITLLVPWFWKIINVVKNFLPILRGGLAVISGPVGWIVAIAGLIAMLIDWGRVFDAVGNLASAFGNVLVAVWDRIIYAAGVAWDWLKNAAGAVVEFFRPVLQELQPVADFIAWLSDTITTLLVGAINSLGDALNSLAGWISPTVQKGNELDEALRKGAEGAGIATEKQEALARANETAKAAMGKHADALQEAIDKGEVFGAVTGKVKEKVDKLGGGVDTATDKVEELVKSFEAAAKPADALEEDLAILVEKFGLHQVVKVYGDKILDAAKAHKELNGPNSLPKTVAEAEKLAKVMAAATKAIDEQNKVLDPFTMYMRDSGYLQEKYERQQKGYTMTVDGVTHSFLGWTDSVLALGKGMEIANDGIFDSLGLMQDSSYRLGEMEVAVDDTSDALAASQRTMDSWSKKQEEATEKGSELAKQWNEAWSHAIGNVVGGWIDGLFEMRFSLDQFGSDIISMVKDLGKTLLKLVVGSIFKPILGAANSFGNQLGETLGGWLNSLFNTQRFGFGGGGGGGGVPGLDLFGAVKNLFTGGAGPLQVASSTTLTAGAAAGPISIAGLQEALPLWTAGGPMPAAGYVPGAPGAGGLSGYFGGTSLMGFLGPGLLGAGIGNLIGGKAGGAIGGIAGGLLAPLLPALFSNPLTAILGGGLLGGKFLYDKFFKKSPTKSGSKEIQRDFGVSVSESLVTGLLKAIGIGEKQFENFRKSITGSPIAFETVLFPEAQSQGKVEQLIAAYGKFAVSPAFESILKKSGLKYQAGGGGFLVDLSEAARKATEGNFAALNEAFLKLFGESGLKDAFGDLSRFLSQTVGPLEEDAEKAGEELVDGAAETRRTTERAAMDLEQKVGRAAAEIEAMAEETKGPFKETLLGLAEKLRSVDPEGLNEELDKAAEALRSMAEDSVGPIKDVFERLADKVDGLAEATEEMRRAAARATSRMEERPEAGRPGAARGENRNMFGFDLNETWVERQMRLYGDLGTPGNRPQAADALPGYNIFDILDQAYPGWDVGEFQHGGPVPRTGYGLLHGGEFVLPERWVGGFQKLGGALREVMEKMGGSLGNLRQRLTGLSEEMMQLREADRGMGNVEGGFAERERGRQEVHIHNHINTIDARGVKQFVEQQMTEILLTNLELRYGERVARLVETSVDAVRSR